MAKKTIKAQMKQRRDTKANWEATNPVLLDGELGIVSDDPNLYKVGDGATAWNSLPFRGFDGTLAQELGTSPNSVISQKVVSEKLTELESNQGNIYIDGLGSTDWAIEVFNLIPGHRYMFQFKNPDWVYSGEEIKLYITHRINGEAIRDVIVTYDSNVAESYIVDAVECDESNKYTVGLKANVGERIFIDVTDITSFIPLKKTIISPSLEKIEDNIVYISSVVVISNDGTRETITPQTAYTFDIENGLVLVLNGGYIVQRLDLSSIEADDVILLSYNPDRLSFTGGALLPYLNTKEIKDLRNKQIKGVFSPSLTSNGNIVTIPTLSVIKTNGTRETITPQTAYTFDETNGLVLVLNILTNSIEQRTNLSAIESSDIILLSYYDKNESFTGGALLPYLNTKQVSYRKDIAITDANLEVSGNKVYISRISLVDSNGERTYINSYQTYEFNEENGQCLVIDNHNIIVQKKTLGDIQKGDIVLLSYHAASGNFIGGELLPFVNTKLIKSISISVENNNPLGLHTLPSNQGQLNVIKRCRQLTDIEWTPAVDLPKLGVNALAGIKEYFEDVFKAGITYKGIPYGRCTTYKPEYGYADTYVGLTIDLSTFVTSVGNKDSMVCKETVFDINDHRTLPYAVVCSALTCYALNVGYYPTSQIPQIPGLDYVADVIQDGILMDLNLIELGDVLNKEADHCAVVTDIVKNGDSVEYVEICEATSMGNGNRDIKGGQLGGVCRRIAFNVDNFFSYFNNYKLYRYSLIESVPYTKNPYVNVGNELDEKPYLHYSVMPYEGNNFKYKLDKNPSVKLLISCKGYDYLRVFKNGNEIDVSPIAISDDDEFKTIITDLGVYRAYLSKMSNDIDVARTDECQFFVA